VVPEPDPDEEVSVEEALENASVFDDLEGLAGSVDDVDDLGDVEGAGTFGDLFGGANNDPAGDGPTTEDDGEDFSIIRDRTERVDPESLQAELEEVSFGEFDDDDDMAIGELVELDPREGKEGPTDDPTEVEMADVFEGDTSQPFEIDESLGPEDRSDVGDVATAASDPTEIEDPETDADDIAVLIRNVSFDDPNGTTEAGPDPTTASEGSGVETGPNDGHDTEPDSDADAETVVTPTSDTDADSDVGVDLDVEPEDTPVDPTQDPDQDPNPDVEQTEDLDASGLDDVAPTTEDHPDATPGPADDPGADTDFERDEATVEFADSFGEAFGTGANEAGDVPTANTLDPVVGAPDGVPEAVEDDDGHVGGSVSVDVETADEMLALTERLLTAGSRLDRASNGVAPAVEDAIDEVTTAATELEETVRDARMVPIEEAYRGLSRVVRDATRGTEKRVNFETVGGDVELDRSVVDAVGDPLVHLVKNAVDHGVAPPEEREAAGKSTEASVTVRTERVGDEAVVTVEDDGRGIDPEDVRRRAVDRGLLDPAETPTEDELLDLVFEPGLSTAEEVTNTSGRGVGTDVVDRVVADLDGAVDVESNPGEGTVFRLTLPVSVAADELLFVKAGGRRFALPADAVDRVTDLDGNAVDDGTGTYAITRRTNAGVDGAGDDGGATAVEVEVEVERETVPFVRLAEVLDVEPSRGPGVAVHLREQYRRAVLAVDDIGQWRKVVVTPYTGFLDAVPGVDGATTLGDGEVITVVDVETLRPQDQDQDQDREDRQRE
jgi:two-component system chemotaxis sensor kinase CheA